MITAQDACKESANSKKIAELMKICEDAVIKACVEGHFQATIETTGLDSKIRDGLKNVLNSLGYQWFESEQTESDKFHVIRTTTWLQISWCING